MGGMKSGPPNSRRPWQIILTRDRLFAADEENAGDDQSRTDQLRQ